MAFFKRVQKKVNDLWYPQSVTWGKAVTTRVRGKKRCVSKFGRSENI